MTIEIYKCTPRQVRSYVIDVLSAGLVPFVQSSPGMGKSSIMRSICDEMSLQMIDHRLSTSAPEDLSGLPHFNERGEALFAPFADLFPLAHTPVPQGKEGWMLFLDEFNSASKGVQAAAYKLILDKMTGQHPLHQRCVISAAGNLATDRAIVNNISTAMQSRVVHLEMRIDFDDWLMDVALKQNYNPMVVAYLSRYPEQLMDFRPDHQEKTFNCPRTWEFVNRLTQGKEVTPAMTPLLAGTISSGSAVSFVQFCSIFSTLVSVDDIIKDPSGTTVPTDTNTKWAVISHMMDRVKDDTFDKLAQYADRFDLSFRILFYRGTMVRHPTLKRHPAFIRALVALNTHLHGAL